MRKKFLGLFILFVGMSGISWAVPPTPTPSPSVTPPYFNNPRIEFTTHYETSLQNRQINYALRHQLITPKDVFTLRNNLRRANLLGIQFFKNNGKKELTVEQQKQVDQILDENSAILNPIAGELSPKTYVVREGDTLWSIASENYKDPYKWPLLRQIDNTPIKNPDIIKPGLKIMIYPDFDENQNIDIVTFASKYKEDSYQDSDYEKKFPKTKWNPNYPDGADRNMKSATGDGRIYVLGDKGQTIYGYDMNSKLLCEIPVKEKPDDPYQAVGLKYCKFQTGEEVILLKNSEGKRRKIEIQMPAQFTPQPTATPCSIKYIYFTFVSGLSDRDMTQKALQMRKYGYTTWQRDMQHDFYFMSFLCDLLQQYNPAVLKDLNMQYQFKTPEDIIKDLKNDPQIKYVGFTKPPGTF